jgi:hypothetical protein
MVKIYFTSGKEFEFDYDWQLLAPKFQLGGVRMFKTPDGTLIPLNSNTIERIELIPDEEPEFEDEPMDEPEKVIIPEEPEIAEEIPEPAKDKPKSAQEKADEKMEKYKELSSCPHEEHIIFYQESTVGKSRKPVRRYFPVCKKCALREKFIKADLLPKEVKEAAHMWTDKTADEIKAKFLNG